MAKSVLNMNEETKGSELIVLDRDSLITINKLVDSIDQQIGCLKALMKSTTQELLNGKEILVDTKIIQPGDRYHDERGKDMWDFLENRLKLNKGTSNE